MKDKLPVEEEEEGRDPNCGRRKELGPKEVLFLKFPALRDR